LIYLLTDFQLTIVVVSHLLVTADRAARRRSMRTPLATRRRRPTTGSKVATIRRRPTRPSCWVSLCVMVLCDHHTSWLFTIQGPRAS